MGLAAAGGGGAQEMYATPQGDGQTRKHGKWRHLKANGNWNGNRGTSACASCRVGRTCLVCSTGVEMCGWPHIVGGQRHSLKNEIITVFVAMIFLLFSAEPFQRDFWKRDLLKRADVKRLFKSV